MRDEPLSNADVVKAVVVIAVLLFATVAGLSSFAGSSVFESEETFEQWCEERNGTVVNDDSILVDTCEWDDGSSVRFGDVDLNGYDPGGHDE